MKESSFITDFRYAAVGSKDSVCRQIGRLADSSVANVLAQVGEGHAGFQLRYKHLPAGVQAED
jgi:hypothetical protein